MKVLVFSWIVIYASGSSALNSNHFILASKYSSTHIFSKKSRPCPRDRLMQDFSAKVVWISGASSGIGEALAHEFHQRGASVILSARREAQLQQIKNEVDERMAILPMDVSRIDELQDKYEQAKDFFGDIDILVNNAGISQRSLVINTSLEVDKRIMQVNYFGNIALTKTVLPSMIGRGSGRIVVISSVAGKLSTAQRSAYSASKHALHGFYDSLRAEVAEHNIQVHMICPGYVQTEISVHALTSHGEPHGIMDENQKNGMPASQCAQKIIQAIRNNKKEFYVGGKEIYFASIRRLFPSLYFRIIERMAKAKKI